MILRLGGSPGGHKGRKSPQGIVMIISIYFSFCFPFRSQIFLTDICLLTQGSDLVGGYQSVELSVSHEFPLVVFWFCLGTDCKVAREE